MSYVQQASKVHLSDDNGGGSANKHKLKIGLQERSAVTYDVQPCKQADDRPAKGAGGRPRRMRRENF